MSAGVCWNDNRTANNNMPNALQSTYSFTLDRNIKYMYKECNQSNQHVESGKSCESVKCTCDPGSNATCTCTGATTRATTDGSATPRHTSFPCSHCRDNDSTASGLVRKHKYTSIRSTASKCATATDYIEREYADYLSATSTKGQGVGARVWSSDEPRDFKQANADSGDSIERRTGIPAGVTV